MAEDDSGQTMITTPVLCQLLMLSRQRVDQLVKDGFIRKRGHNEFALVEAVQGYIRFLRDDAKRNTKSAADNRVREARAIDIELRTQERLRHLVPLDLYEQMIEGLCGMVRTEFGGLAAETSRDLQQRRIIDKAVHAKFRRLAELALEMQLRQGAGGSTVHAVGANGAGRMGSGEPDIPTDSGGAGSA